MGCSALAHGKLLINSFEFNFYHEKTYIIIILIFFLPNIKIIRAIIMNIYNKCFIYIWFEYTSSPPPRHPKFCANALSLLNTKLKKFMVVSSAHYCAWNDEIRNEIVRTGREYITRRIINIFDNVICHVARTHRKAFTYDKVSLKLTIVDFY